VIQGRLAGKAFTESVGVVAWENKPSWFIITTDDRVVSVELQTAETRRMNAKTARLASSHMSLESHPRANMVSLRGVTPTAWIKRLRRCRQHIP